MRNLLNQMRGSWGEPAKPSRPAFLFEEPGSQNAVATPIVPEFAAVEVCVPDEVALEVATATEPSTGEQSTTVTLSLNLTTEQALNLYKAALGTQRSVLTPREAAAYLRASEETMEYLALNNSLPSFQVDGQRRFLKTQLDAWIENQIQTSMKENTHAR